MAAGGGQDLAAPLVRGFNDIVRRISCRGVDDIVDYSRAQVHLGHRTVMAGGETGEMGEWWGIEREGQVLQTWIGG